MRRLVTLCAVAGCGSSTGADIRVTAPPGVARVELFVGETCKPGGNSETCDTAVAWDLSNGKLEGEVFILDVDAVTEADPLDDTHFRIQLKAPDPQRTLKRMVFLGYTPLVGTSEQILAATVLHDVDIKTSTGEQWEIELTPIEEIPAQPSLFPPGRDVDRVHVWNRSEGALARCVVHESWRSGQVTREFLVPPGDTDCDDVDVECDPYYWNDPGSVSSSALSCTTVGSVDAARGTSCLFGGKACSELDAVSDCAPAVPSHCAGTKACLAGCQADLGACIGALQLATFSCTVPSDASGQPCVNTSGSDFDVIPLDVSALVGGSPSNCGGTVELAVPTLSPSFQDPLPIGTISLEQVIDPTTPGGCHMRVKWSGSRGNTEQYPLLLAIPLDNGTVVVPSMLLSISFNSCDTPPSCSPSIASTDDILDCAHFPRRP